MVEWVDGKKVGRKGSPESKMMTATWEGSNGAGKSAFCNQNIKTGSSKNDQQMLNLGLEIGNRISVRPKDCLLVGRGKALGTG